MKEGNFHNKEWITNIRKLLTGKASSIYQEMNVNGNAVPGIQDLAPRKTWLHRDTYQNHSLAQ